MKKIKSSQPSFACTGEGATRGQGERAQRQSLRCEGLPKVSRRFNSLCLNHLNFPSNHGASFDDVFVLAAPTCMCSSEQKKLEAELATLKAKLEKERDSQKVQLVVINDGHNDELLSLDCCWRNVSIQL
jgi:hypothetical protein